jgi:hypothetical protein
MEWGEPTNENSQRPTEQRTYQNMKECRARHTKDIEGADKNIQECRGECRQDIYQGIDWKVEQDIPEGKSEKGCRTRNIWRRMCWAG